MTAAYNLPMSYYKHHVFFCLNQRQPGETSCADHDAQGAADHCKKRVKAAGLNGPGGVRINKAGCLDRCAGGPVIVVYPDETWYTYVDQHDLNEIVDSHLVKGQKVERLLLPPHIGK
jgi:(2Fe-2S) ferredoxin